MASFVISLLAAMLAAVPVWALFGPAEALGTAVGLALVLWPLMALARRIMGGVIDALGEAITARRARMMRSARLTDSANSPTSFSRPTAGGQW